MTTLATDARILDAEGTLVTPRLRLCTQQAADIPFLVALWMDPLATRFMGGPRERAQLEGLLAAPTPLAPTLAPPTRQAEATPSPTPSATRAP
jgi:hypothetical protein